jgi:DNA-binding IclR family transcriptional regulator
VIGILRSSKSLEHGSRRTDCGQVLSLRIMKRTPTIQSVERALILLAEVGRVDQPLSLRELAGVLGIDRSSVFRLAWTLQCRGFLVQLPDRKHYAVGPAIQRLADQARWADIFNRFGQQCAATLADETNEVAHLAVREGQIAIIVLDQHPELKADEVNPGGSVVPLHCTAIGKALLMQFNRDELASLYGPNKLPIMTKKTIQSMDQLIFDCDLARERGFTLDDEEFHDGVRCVAAPVKDRGGIVAAVGVSTTTGRFSKGTIQSVADIVIQAATGLSTELGFQPFCS